MDITLVRHTKVDVAQGTVYGFTDVPLADTFISEAQAVSERLAGEIFDAVYSSPLSRCRKLATFCGYPHPHVDDRLKEMNFGEWEMKKWEEIESSEAEKWFNDWINRPTPHGECFKDQYIRIAEFLDELKQTEDRTVCVFAHGGVLRCALIYAGQITFEQAFEQDIPYGAVIRIKI